MCFCTFVLQRTIYVNSGGKGRYSETFGKD